MFRGTGPSATTAPHPIGDPLCDRLAIRVEPMNRNETPKNSRKNILIGLILGGMSLFMYVSFILTTAFKGP